MNGFLKELKDRVLIYDGSKGTMLQRFGLKGGESPELWNVTHSQTVRKIYAFYKDSGSDVIQTNTFQGNRICLEKYSLGDRIYELNYEGARLAREVMGRDGYVAASIGPTGRLFEPLGELTFEQAYEVFKEQILAVVDGGVDVINFETFTDLSELRAALLAAKEATGLPVICSMAFESNGRTLMGTDPLVAAIVLNSLGADMVGANCSFGPGQMMDIIRKMSEISGIYLCAKPNAGLPEIVEGKTFYSETAEDFARYAPEFLKYGVRLIGGCCGTTPEFIKAIKDALNGFQAPVHVGRRHKVITSDLKMVNIENIETLKIAQVDASSDGKLARELMNGNIEFIFDKSSEIFEEGCDAVYINVDAVGVGKDLLAEVVNNAQSVLKAPFILETASSTALDKALRLYRGKAGVVIDSDSNSGIKIEDLLVTAKKYGSTVIEKGLLNHV